MYVAVNGLRRLCRYSAEFTEGLKLEIGRYIENHLRICIPQSASREVTIVSSFNSFDPFD